MEIYYRFSGNLIGGDLICSPEDGGFLNSAGEGSIYLLYLDAYDVVPNGKLLINTTAFKLPFSRIYGSFLMHLTGTELQHADLQVLFFSVVKHCSSDCLLTKQFDTTMPMQQLTFVPAAGKSIMCKGESVDMTQQEANEDHNHILDTLNHPWSVVPPEIRSL
ncbi:unnamed protein product [Citrullus colocynthis]|uniref:Uncharacterized protein n=1 Tax=Citrullus colocynthis TaxID=252529 RepID=A0ABP0YDR3_9ROSI